MMSYSILLRIEGLTHQNTFDKNSNSVLKFWIIIIITMLILIILGIIIITIAVKYGQKIHDKVTTLLGTVKKEAIEPSEPRLDAEESHTVAPEHTWRARLAAKLRRRKITIGDAEQAGDNGAGAAGDIEMGVRERGVWREV